MTTITALFGFNIHICLGRVLLMHRFRTSVYGVRAWFCPCACVFLIMYSCRESVLGTACDGQGQASSSMRQAQQAADHRALAVTSVTPGRKGLSTSRQSCIGCVTQNWRLAEAERGSAELRGALARSHCSLLPPLKLLALPRPSSPPQLSAPHAFHCQAW